MDERLFNPISTAELERRWAAVRKIMAERKIDALVMQNSNDFARRLCALVHRHAPQQRLIPRSVIFPARDLMTRVDMGGERRAPQARRRRRRPTVASARCSSRRPCLGGLHRRISGRRSLPPSSSAAAIAPSAGSAAAPCRTTSSPASSANSTGQAKFVDVTEFIDRLKALKSEEEKELIRKCAPRCRTQSSSGRAQGDPPRHARQRHHRAGAVRGPRARQRSRDCFSARSAPLGQASRFIDRHFQGAQAARPASTFAC